MPTQPKNQKLVVNPTLDIRLTVGTRRKGEPRTFFEVPVSDGTTDLLGLIARVVSIDPRARTLPASVKANLDFLLESGILIPSGEAPAEVLPPTLQPKRHLELVPEVFRRRAQLSLEREKPVFNRGLVFLPNEIERDPPEQPGVPPAKNYPIGNSFVWVLDPGTRMWAPYGMSREGIKVVSDLASGRLKPERLGEDWRELLWHARIVVGRGYRKQRERHWSVHWARQARLLKSERYTVLREVLAPLQIALMRGYYRDLESEGYLDIDQKQVKFKRFSRHNDPLLQFVHRQSGHLVRRVTGENIFPSYSYLSAYMEGAQLKRHLDRPQCAWNASLLIDQEPEVNLSDSWPMYLETPRGEKEVRLDFGDVVFYSGTELPHWRNRISPQHRQTLGLLHYVPVDFTGSLE